MHTAIFKAKILEESAENNKSIHIFRGFRKQITSPNPEDDTSDNHWIVLYMWEHSCWSMLLYNPNLWWVSMFSYCTRGSTRKFPFDGKLSRNVKVWSGMWTREWMTPTEQEIFIFTKRILICNEQHACRLWHESASSRKPFLAPILYIVSKKYY